jgi:hypothetical protein
MTMGSGAAGEARAEARDENKTERARERTIAAAQMDASRKQATDSTREEGASVSRAFEH